QNSCNHFFFQAEDDIRDFHVTGVQTCALPISFDYWELLSNEDEPKDIIVRFRSEDDSTYIDEFAPLVVNFSNVQGIPYWIVNLRSEERRVGKECRSRWSWEH